MRLFDGRGIPLELGRELGRGGEGSVFEVLTRTELVAKLYHVAPENAKQDKLQYMVSSADAKLSEFSAWPLETLHASRGSPVKGFLMRRIAAMEPIHKLYSPVDRKKTFPDKGWDFLLHVARNVAAAFESLHSHGHVVGDVNQGNVVVGSNGRVAFIDCDSFQINANGRVHF